MRIPKASCGVKHTHNPTVLALQSARHTRTRTNEKHKCGRYYGGQVHAETVGNQRTPPAIAETRLNYSSRPWKAIGVPAVDWTVLAVLDLWFGLKLQINYRRFRLFGQTLVRQS